MTGFGVDWPVDPAKYALFLGVTAVMAITPGPANLFAVSTGISRGARAALIGVAGMNTAMLVWFTAAALGLAALVTAFPAQFRLIAMAGAIYVAWLGLKALWAAGTGNVTPLDKAKAASPGAAFRDGFAVQISNPKAVLFFSAVVPPFLDLGRPIPPQMVMLAVATIGADLIAMSAYGLAGGALSERMTQPGARRAFSAVVGVLFLAAAALIFFHR